MKLLCQEELTLIQNCPNEKLNVAEILISVFNRSEKIVGKGINAGYKHFLLFSSPEHEVLMVSFCDRPMSVVRRVLSVVHRPQFL